MRKIEFSHYSHHLNRNMNIKIYGHYGITFLIFPCQDGMSDDFEINGMISCLSNFIESGQIKLVCVDSIDYETYSNKFGNYEHRAYMQEKYVQYIIDEVMPIIYEENQGFTLPYVSGCSMGATQASILFFRRPDLFRGVLGLSGCYEISYFWNNWCNHDIYNNSPVKFLRQIPNDHPYIHLYNQKNIIFCVGNGVWEHLVSWSHYQLKEILESKGINAWMDTWGDDVAHHWYWWEKQYQYFIPKLIENY